MVFATHNLGIGYKGQFISLHCGIRRAFNRYSMFSDVITISHPLPRLRTRRGERSGSSVDIRA